MFCNLLLVTVGLSRRYSNRRKMCICWDFFQRWINTLHTSVLEWVFVSAEWYISFSPAAEGRPRPLRTRHHHHQVQVQTLRETLPQQPPHDQRLSAKETEPGSSSAPHFIWHLNQTGQSGLQRVHSSASHTEQHRTDRQTAQNLYAITRRPKQNQHGALRSEWLKQQNPNGNLAFNLIHTYTSVFLHRYLHEKNILLYVHHVLNVLKESFCLFLATKSLQTTPQF